MKSSNTESLIFSFLNNHQYHEAKALAKKFLLANQQSHRANYLLALSLLLCEETEVSINYFKKAISLFSSDAAYFCNLGLAYLRINSLDEAKRNLLKALELKKDYDDAKYNLACVHVHLSESKEAKLILKQLIKQTPKQAPIQAKYICLLADAERVDKQWQRAFRLYLKAIKSDKNCVEARINLSPLLIHLGRYEKAAEHCRFVIEQDSKQFLAHQHLGDCLLAMELPDEAMHAYADAFEIKSDNADLCVKIANSWLDINDLSEAGTWFERALQLDNNSLKAKIGLANVYRESQEESTALEILLPLEEEGKQNMEFLMAFGEAHWDEGNSEEALQCFTAARDLEPQRVGIYSRIGRVLSSAGDVDGALEQYRTALQINKNAIPALSGLAVTLKGKLEEKYALKMEEMLNKPNLRAGARATLHNGLAFYYEGQRNYQSAAEHSRLANQFQWESKSKAAWDYSIEKHHQQVQRLKETFDQRYFAALKNLGSSSEVPVFVVSMPRSGTTLTEQILARHHQVLGIGERNYASRGFAGFRESFKIKNLNKDALLANLNPSVCDFYAQAHLSQIEQMVKKSKKENVIRVVDKMPDNYHQIGWLKTIFPKCKIIHIRRDPRDVALSCWFTQFGAIQWACNVDHLVDRIKTYQELMAHWRLVMAGDMLEIDYENLVADQEGVSRKMIEWIGLEWDENCLSFYESDRLVRTASITQVRQPIYTQSVKKWENYLPYLPDLLEPLAFKL